MLLTTHATCRLVVAILTLLASSGRAAAATIWIEGEDARSHNMRRHGWYDSVTKESLSGGEWLSHFGGGTPPEAEFAFDVPRPGDYHFWIRCNPVGSPRLSYRLDTGSWTEVPMSRPVGVVNIAADGKPDLRFIAWVEVGSVRLERGSHTVRFRFHSRNNHHGAIDCFVFSLDPFRPRGTLKPGQRSHRANPGFFAWEPDTDRFGSQALVDLRFLNEDAAGQDGPVRAVGTDLVLGNGEKVRFWAANAGPAVWRFDHDSHVYLARRLAKSGVNMVRLHGAIYGRRNPAVDRQRLDDLHHLVSSLKDEGIYVALSFYFPLWFQLDGDQPPFMLLFFDRELQDMYFDWADALLNTENPYTKLPLGKDPCVALVEIVNEDSHFFWTFGKKNMPESRWKTLTARYGDWLTEKYGALDKAVQAWGGVNEADDAPEAGRMELYGAWEMTTEGIRARPNIRKRLRDQVQFLTENMRGFYGQAIEHLRDACHYQGLVSCGNWHVTDAAKLDALERYCYTMGDVIDHHGYFDHGHRGEAATWSVRPGQTFESQSALHLRAQNPLPYVETDGYPHIVSEIGWPLPNMYHAEFPFLASTYGAQQGLDGVFSFAIGSAGWDEDINKFAFNTPAVLGCSPAAALIYRRGYVQEAPIVVKEHLRLEDLYNLQGTALWVAGALDQFRAASIPPGITRMGPVEGIDPLTFYVGRVVRSFQGKPEDSFQRSVAQHIDRQAKSVTSVTGQLALDYGRGVATVNTTKAQGAAGFLGRRGPIKLDDVTIQMDNDYGTVTIVALDDRPIRQSNQILIQAMTVEQLYGFRASGRDNLSGRIEDVGTAPWGVERIKASVTLRLQGERPSIVTACDEHTYPTGKTVHTSAGADGLTVILDETSPYHVVQRKATSREHR